MSSRPRTLNKLATILLAASLAVSVIMTVYIAADDSWPTPLNHGEALITAALLSSLIAVLLIVFLLIRRSTEVPVYLSARADSYLMPVLENTEDDRADEVKVKGKMPKDAQ